MAEEVTVKYVLEESSGCIYFYLPDLNKAFGIKIHKPGKLRGGWISYCDLRKLADDINELIRGFDETLVSISEKHVKFISEKRDEKGDAADGRRSAGSRPGSR